jgi:hypothetical protein
MVNTNEDIFMNEFETHLLQEADKVAAKKKKATNTPELPDSDAPEGQQSDEEEPSDITGTEGGEGDTDAEEGGADIGDLGEEGEDDKEGGESGVPPEKEEKPKIGEKIPPVDIDKGLGLRRRVMNDFDGQLPEKISDLMSIIAKKVDIENNEANTKILFKVPPIGQEVINVRELEEEVGVEIFWGTLYQRIVSIKYPQQNTIGMEKVEDSLQGLQEESINRFYAVLGETFDIRKAKELNENVKISKKNKRKNARK